MTSTLSVTLVFIIFKIRSKTFAITSALPLQEKNEMMSDVQKRCQTEVRRRGKNSDLANAFVSSKILMASCRLITSKLASW